MEAKYKSDCEYTEKVAKRENKPVEYPEKPTYLVIKVGDKVLYDESKDGELKDAAAITPASTPTPTAPAATPAAEPKAETPAPAPAAEPKAETPAPVAEPSVDADPFAQFTVQ